MKNLILLVVVLQLSQLFAQSDNCTGVVPTLPVGSSCSPTNYSLPTTFADNFATEPSCGNDYRDGFFQFTATSVTTSITLTDGTPAGPNPGMMVVSGTCGGTLTSHGCSQNPNGMNELITFTTVVGQVYYVVIFTTNAGGTGAPTNATTGTVCVTNYVSSGPVSASDCPNYVNICSNAGFQIDPNGYGTINEIPASGSYGNPYYDGWWDYNPWGTDNMGCLQSDENNSTWMVINVYSAGNLAFSFGAGGAQAGYYDWIMYPYSGPGTCSAISNNLVAPVRCNWNASNTGGTGLASTLPAGGSAGNYEPVLPVTANSQYIICFSNYSSATTTVPIAFSGTATVGCSALGANTSNFTVDTDCDGGDATISWEAPLDVSSTYQVQRSSTGETWEIIGTVETPSGSDESNQLYTFRDELAQNKIILYRLKEINSNGISSYSELKSVICKSDLSPNTLAPNPSSELTNLTYYSKQAGTLHIFDAVGRPIEEIPLENTNSKIVLKPIDVSKLQSGAYRFVLDLGTETTIIQFIKK